MNTKNIFKVLALAMLMPATMLTTACSSDDHAVNNEQTAKKGFEIPVTVTATRQGSETRATFEGGKLNFSPGDKLNVWGTYGGSKYFAGTLDMISEGTFSGTISTQDDSYGTIDDLLASARATLLPNGYESYGHLIISELRPLYERRVTIIDDSYKLATSKGEAVEQFSDESGTFVGGSFALSPFNAILNFTITGLSDGVNNVVLTTTDPTDPILIYSGNITVSGGTASFAMGVYPERGNLGSDLNNLTMTVAGNPITLVSSSTPLAAGKIYNITRSIVDLSTISSNYTAQNGETLTGTLANNVKISIADGATVTLNNVNINGSDTWTSGNYACITCLGDATIILSGTNTVKGFYENYPGIQAAVGKTLTINGTGSLTARSNGYGVGIGGGYNIACGNIEIQGGTITATGGNQEAGIGGGRNANCGTITISGGTVTATGGSSGAGIGSGDHGTCGTITISGGTVTATGGNSGAGIGSGLEAGCGDITITSGVTSVTATKGSSNSIGAGLNGSCGTVTIDGVANATTSSTFTNFNSSVSGNTWTLTHK